MPTREPAASLCPSVTNKKETFCFFVVLHLRKGAGKARYYTGRSGDTTAQAQRARVYGTARSAARVARIQCERYGGIWYATPKSRRADAQKLRLARAMARQRREQGSKLNEQQLTADALRHIDNA